jgi:hypothetical protein
MVAAQVVHAASRYRMAAVQGALSDGKAGASDEDGDGRNGDQLAGSHDYHLLCCWWILSDGCRWITADGSQRSRMRTRGPLVCPLSPGRPSGHCRASAIGDTLRDRTATGERAPDIDDDTSTDWK